MIDFIESFNFILNLKYQWLNNQWVKTIHRYALIRYQRLSYKKYEIWKRQNFSLGVHSMVDDNIVLD